MKKVIIYGASKGGQNTLRYLKGLNEDFEFLGFVDGDSNKHGTTIAGLKVDAPESLKDREFDIVFIGSSYVDEIWQTLQGLGVPSEKVEPLDYTILNGPTRPWGCIIIAAVVAAGLAWFLLK